jgi:plastocyanin
MTNTMRSLISGVLLCGSAVMASAATDEKLIEHNMLMDHGAGHLMDMDGGMVMGQNKETLPPGCSRVSEDAAITVRAGHQYSKDYPGTMFAFDTHEWRVKPCTRLTVTFINEDHIRHQWMMHGLPKFIYDKGMFHLEMTGPAKITGTLILPAEDRTYLVHCDIAQHMENGMKGQLIVGKGSTPFPSIPGLTDLAIPDDYGDKVADSVKPVAVTPAAIPGGAAGSASAGNTSTSVAATQATSGKFILGLILGIVGAPVGFNFYKRRYQHMSNEEVLKDLQTSAGSLMDKLIGFLTTLVGGVRK